ncbi:hypothetical protein [Pontibacter litorisediminis]|uniref:hypothetical protein n=1 Tax=Pontibacter litorisediminis TaxID=1846260 RepID=UPI0023ED4172|nr:hypothetical protein [Pontibacter litorisediminis]
MLSTLILFLTLTVNPAPKFAFDPLQTQLPQTDSVALLSNTWVLREQFHAHNGTLEPVSPYEKLELTFRKNGTYTLSRHYGAAGAGSVEEGRWQLDASRGEIHMQTREVDGRSILSTMLPRWEIKELKRDKLVLRFFAMSGAYLVLEAKN